MNEFDIIWDELFPLEQKRILDLLIESVIVCPKKIIIMLHPLGISDLYEKFTGDSLFTQPINKLEFKKSYNQPIKLEFAVNFKKRGGQKFLIAPDGTDAASTSEPRQDSTMIRAIARAFEWLEKLENGTAKNLAQLSEQENFSDSYISKALKLTDLSPEIISIILAGRQPKSLTLTDLFADLPDDWREQKRVLGFPDTN